MIGLKILPAHHISFEQPHTLFASFFTNEQIDEFIIQEYSLPLET